MRLCLLNSSFLFMFHVLLAAAKWRDEHGSHGEGLVEGRSWAEMSQNSCSRSRHRKEKTYDLAKNMYMIHIHIRTHTHTYEYIWVYAYSMNNYEYALANNILFYTKPSSRQGWPSPLFVGQKSFGAVNPILNHPQWLTNTEPFHILLPHWFYHTKTIYIYSIYIYIHALLAILPTDIEKCQYFIFQQSSKPPFGGVVHVSWGYIPQWFLSGNQHTSDYMKSHHGIELNGPSTWKTIAIVVYCMGNISAFFLLTRYPQ